MKLHAKIPFLYLYGFDWALFRVQTPAVEMNGYTCRYVFSVNSFYMLQTWEFKYNYLFYYVEQMITSEALMVSNAENNWLVGWNKHPF